MLQRNNIGEKHIVHRKTDRCTSPDIKNKLHENAENIEVFHGFDKVAWK